MDSDLAKFFTESKPASLPQVTVKALPKPEDLAKPQEPVKVEEEVEGPKPLSRREKAKEKLEPEERLRRTLFVGNVPVAVCKSKPLQRALKKKFAVHGKLVSIRFRSVGFSKAMPRKVAYATQQFHEERDSVNAYIVMENEEEARKAVAENSTVFEGRHLRVDIASAERKNDTKKSVFIGNLPLSVSEETIWEFFGSCGQVTNVRIVRDKTTNLGKGFGYVTFSDKGTIELALQLAGTDCGGRPIRISKCTKEGFHKETKLFKEKQKQVQDAANTDGTAAQKKPSANSNPFKKTTARTSKPAPAKFAAKSKTSEGSSKPFMIMKPTERNQPGASVRKPSFQSGASARKPSFQSGASARKPSFQSGASARKPSFQSGASTRKPSFQSGASTRKPAFNKSKRPSK